MVWSAQQMMDSYGGVMSESRNIQTVADAEKFAVLVCETGEHWCISTPLSVQFELTEFYDTDAYVVEVRVVGREPKSFTTLFDAELWVDAITVGGAA